jgi:uncharacterized protein YciI
MFIVLMTYKKPLDIIDQFLSHHRAHLDKGYRDNLLVASGPRNPRTGGVLISHATDKTKLEAFLKLDPFVANEIAKYDIIEFNPVKYHSDFISFIDP